MKFSNPIEEDGLSEQINNVCGSNNSVFSNKEKVSKVNNALNRYSYLARKSGKKWVFDDHDNTSPPIETQSIVSGTNRYKFDAFTSEIIDILKFEALNASGKGYNLIPEDINNLPSSFEELYLNTNKQTGTPLYYCKYGDFVYLRPTPDYAETDALKVYFNRPITKYTFKSFTVTVATPGIFTSVAHGLVAGDAVILETDGALPTGLTADTTVYYVVAGGTADTFELSLTIDGAISVITTGTQSGSHKFLNISKEPGIPSIHHLYLVRNVAMNLMIQKGLEVKNDLASQLQEDEREIIDYFNSRDRDIKNIMTNAPIRGGKGWR